MVSQALFMCPGKPKLLQVLMLCLKALGPWVSVCLVPGFVMSDMLSALLV